MIRHLQYPILIFLLLANVFVWKPEAVGRLEVNFLDVGQGDAVYIKTPHGRQLLIDGGPDKSVLRELGEVVPASDRSLDIVLESHPDSDHIGGLPDVLGRFSVKGILDTGNRSTSKLFSTLGDIARAKRDPELKVSAGDQIIIEPGIYLDIISPAGNAENWESNKSSLIARLTYASSSFLFTGDADSSIEKYLTVHQKSLIRADVLKVSHHGSRNSNDAAFLQAVSPEYAVISVGAKNRFGHPHQEVIDNLKKIGTQIIRTDQVGTVKLVSNGQTIEYLK